ncbi:uncharacterized protein LOC130671152 [Microplitis mediator]|uniref:uncharacterized protein LOC130671152 n=1 Tax=Microplitis mediator TaxID=375433 RepID=UPI002555B5D7|nr:uncharacterized protein LOC130671152 [Microplitis mediator]
MGIREGKSCIDAAYVLLAAIHLRLRQTAAKAYLLFVDFKRAFDSAPHELLWKKLYSLGMSTELILILKGLYEQAYVQTKQGSQTTDKFSVTEGVLQGETLSPLLFLLFLADIGTFFRSYGCDGINVNNLLDLLILLHADDTVLLACNVKDMIKLLKLLEKYCDMNDLAVNIKKTI